MNIVAELFPKDQGQKFETSQKTRLRSGTLPSGITMKMDAFARHIAEGSSLADAYRAAFNTANMKAKTVRDDASRLAQHSGVRAAINAHRAKIEAQNRISALERSERLWEGIWSLIEDEEVLPTVKLRALYLAARLCGMLKNTEVHSSQSAAEQETELKRRLLLWS